LLYQLSYRGMGNGRHYTGAQATGKLFA